MRRQGAPSAWAAFFFVLVCANARRKIIVVLLRFRFGNGIDLLAAFAAKLAELERKRIRARVKAGLEAARAKGKTLGRPRVAVNRAKVWTLKDSGRSIREIAATMKLSHGTVQRALASR